MASARRETSFPHFVLSVQPLCFDSRACEEYFRHRCPRNVSVFFGLKFKIPDFRFGLQGFQILTLFGCRVWVFVLSWFRACLTWHRLRQAHATYRRALESGVLKLSPTQAYAVNSISWLGPAEDQVEK